MAALDRRQDSTGAMSPAFSFTRCRHGGAYGGCPHDVGRFLRLLAIVAAYDACRDGRSLRRHRSNAATTRRTMSFDYVEPGLHL